MNGGSGAAGGRWTADGVVAGGGASRADLRAKAPSVLSDK